MKKRKKLTWTEIGHRLKRGEDLSELAARVLSLNELREFRSVVAYHIEPRYEHQKNDASILFQSDFDRVTAPIKKQFHARCKHIAACRHRAIMYWLRRIRRERSNNHA